MASPAIGITLSQLPGRGRKKAHLNEALAASHVTAVLGRLSDVTYRTSLGARPTWAKSRKPQVLRRCVSLASRRRAEQIM
eukprot:1327976-Heterocapsa_arctica.AAC.2